jgi:nitrous oxidase accessory protein NosD
VALITLAAGPQAHGATVLVDNLDGSSDAGGCGTAENPCNTIQAGIDGATAGDTVSVGAGTFDEGVVVNKQVNLEGAQAGVPGWDRTGATETIVRGPGGFETGYAFDVRAAGVRIAGFSITAARYHFGVWLPPEAAGAEVADNIFTYTEGGVGTVLAGADDAWIHHSEFRGGTWSVRAFGSTVERATIEQNSFQTGGGGVEFMSSAEAIDLQILDNASTDTIRIDRALRLTLAGNDVSAANAAGTRLPAFELRSSRDVLIWDNVLVDSYIGIAFFESDPLLSENAEVTGNTIASNSFGLVIAGVRPAYAGIMEVHSNRIVDNEYPLSNEAPAAVGYAPPELGAEDNWWGCNAGLDTPECGFVLEGVAYTEPHLVLSLAAPSAIDPGASATLRADLERNSDGNTVPADLLPPVPVDFAVSQGGVSPPQAMLESGAAVTTFRAPADDQVARASATVDAQTVDADITVGSGARPAGISPPASTVVPKPSSTATRRPFIRLRARTQRVSRKSRVRLVARCAQTTEACKGRLELRLEGRNRLLGRAQFKIPANSERAVHVRLSRATRRLLQRKQRIRVVAQTTGAFAGAAAVSARIRFTLKG